MIHFLVRRKYAGCWKAYFRISRHCFHSYCWTAQISSAFQSETFLQGNNWLTIEILIVKVWCLTFFANTQFSATKYKTILKVNLSFSFQFFPLRGEYTWQPVEMYSSVSCPYHEEFHLDCFERGSSHNFRLITRRVRQSHEKKMKGLFFHTKKSFPHDRQQYKVEVLKKKTQMHICTYSALVMVNSRRSLNTIFTSIVLCASERHVKIISKACENVVADT